MLKNVLKAVGLAGFVVACSVTPQPSVGRTKAALGEACADPGECSPGNFCAEDVCAAGWVSLSTGWDHSCAIRSDGTLWCWGGNGAGEVGDGTTTSRLVPTQESTTATDWAQVSAGTQTTCALKADSTLWCWGSNAHGQFGDGTTTSQLTPTQESTTATDWANVSLGIGSFTCATKTDGTLWCWGINNNGALGDGSTTNRLVPTQESTTATDWAQVSAGYWSSCATKTDGTLWCWGANNYGRLGDGTTTARLDPTQEYTAATDWALVKANDAHTCATKTDGTLWCWGGNNYGQLGDNAAENQTHVPVQEYTAATDWLGVSLAFSHTCATKTDGTVWCWGANTIGQVGDGTTTQRNVPTQESGTATDWAAVDAHNSHTCALKTGGSVWCWGAGAGGPLGNGSSSNQSAPTLIP